MDPLELVAMVVLVAEDADLAAETSKTTTMKLLEQAVLEPFCYTTKMFAIISDNSLVLGWAESNDDAFNKIKNNNFSLIEMTKENSPAFLNGIWDGNKFHEPINEGA
jgi:hypothetical protein